MKAAILSFLLFFLIVHPTAAMTEDRLPVACDSTKKVLEQLKAKQFQLVILGEVERMQTAIFLNDNHDMVIGVTVKVDGQWTTCIFVGAEGNTEIFSPPKKSTNQEKEL